MASFSTLFKFYSGNFNFCFTKNGRPNPRRKYGGGLIVVLILLCLPQGKSKMASLLQLLPQSHVSTCSDQSKTQPQTNFLMTV